MNKILLGVIYAIIAQIGSFLQLQGNVKYGWYEKHPIILLLSSIPLTWFYIHSVKYFVLGFKGELWPSRLIGFGISIVVFSLMSYFLFSEHISLKTFICLLLAFGILAVQFFMK